MTSGSNVPTLSTRATRLPLRLRLKPAEPITGDVDGGWWPWSRDLATELPTLAPALAAQFGPVRQVAFALPAWHVAPRRVEINGRSVRLEGFRSQDENTIYVTGTNHRRISLLVVPPEAPEAAGQDAMLTAADPDNTDATTKILGMSGLLTAAPEPAEPRPVTRVAC